MKLGGPAHEEVTQTIHETGGEFRVSIYDSKVLGNGRSWHGRSRCDGFMGLLRV